MQLATSSESEAEEEGRSQGLERLAEAGGGEGAAARGQDSQQLPIIRRQLFSYNHQTIINSFHPTGPFLAPKLVIKLN